MKVIVPRRYRRSDALVVHLAGSVDVFTQTIVKVSAAASVLNFLLVIKFDFRNQQACKSACVIVQPALFFSNFHRQFGLGNSITAACTQWRGKSWSDRFGGWFRRWNCRLLACREGRFG